MKIEQLTPQPAILLELGERLARVRKRQGMTQEALAAEAGLGVATVRRIEDGSDSQLGSWIKLLKALGMEGAIDGLLPEMYQSPMAEALGDESDRRTRIQVDGESAFQWGDEKP
jgi:transcriptional regulator with XRE-family HTH domain